MTSTIAFCGIDGAGKSSVIRVVKERLEAEQGSDIRVLKRANRYASEIIRRSIAFLSPVDYINGPSAQWSAISAVLDFVNDQYNWAKDMVESDYILYDRYSPCFMSYAHAVDAKLGTLVWELLREVPPPALTFYISISPETAWQRILEREGGPHPDESFELLIRFFEAYSACLPYFNGVIEISNVGDIRQTVDQVIYHMTEKGLLTSGCRSIV